MTEEPEEPRETRDAARTRRRREVIAAVRAERRIVRRQSLVRVGHTQRTIAEAVEAGALLSVRRVWVATPDVDPHLLAAARSGVVLSCVTRARRLGLWVPGTQSESHVAASKHTGRLSPAKGTRVHLGQPVVPRHPDHLEDPIENVLALVCRCQPFEAALQVVESALNRGLVEKQALERLPFRSVARAVIAAASPFSDSGLETVVPHRLRWLGLRIVPQAWIAGHRVDFLIGDRLVLQIDGGHHVGAQRDEDNRHDAVLASMGFHVIRVGYHQVTSDWPAVQALIMQAVAQGLHRV